MTPAAREARAERPVVVETAAGVSMSGAPAAHGQERPTATVRRVDMSSSRRASAAPASSEQLLFRAYGSLKPGQVGLVRVTKVVYDRVEPCACGGELVDDRRSIRRIVEQHNETPLHQAWRAWRETA